MLTRCVSTTPTVPGAIRRPASGTPLRTDGLGQIVPDDLLGGLSQLGRRTGWPFGPFETATTLVEALVRALEARDHYTHGHSIRVARHATRIAREMGLPLGAQEEIRVAASLHDIGKIGIEDQLLNSTEILDEQQRRRILDHTVIGERILEPLFRDRPVILRVARWHHEWFDGTGSPDGLVRSAIPLCARIVAVADAFDAMTSARPYRDALPITVATWELASGAGTQFDPDCVAAFLMVLERDLREQRQRRRRGTPYTSSLDSGTWGIARSVVPSLPNERVSSASDEERGRATQSAITHFPDYG